MRKMILVVATGALLAGCMLDDRRPVGVGVAIGGAPAPVPVGGPPPWAPAHGRRAQVQRYYYYPSAGVYYNVATSSYFYLNGGAWQVGISLPTTVVIDPSAYVSLELDTDRPYLYYEEHRNKYRGWHRRKHESDHEEGHGHGHGRWK